MTAREPRSYLEISRCPVHKWYAVIVGTDDSGIRVTPSKCCGRWDLVKRFNLNARQWTELAELATIASQQEE